MEGRLRRSRRVWLSASSTAAIRSPSTSLQGLLTSINLTPISPTAYSNHQDRFLHDRFVGTGPYQLTRFSEHQQRLEPFAQYWGEAPRNNGLDLITLSNSTALYGALLSGEVDLLLSASIDENQRHTCMNGPARGSCTSRWVRRWKSATSPC